MSIRRRNLHDNNKREIVIENGILKIRDLDGNTVFPTMIAHPNPDSDVAATFFALDLYIHSILSVIEYSSLLNIPV